MVSSITLSRFRPATVALVAVLFWLASLLPSGAQQAPLLVGNLPGIGTQADADPLTVNVAPFFQAQDAAGTVVRLVFTGGVLGSGTGAIDVALTDAATPVTVANFLSYVQAGAYQNSFLHRSGSPESLGIIQGGGFKISDNTSDLSASTLQRLPAALPIVNESSTSRPNARGTIAMARTSDVNSATSQWFINTSDNSTSLGGPDRAGYAVFGNVLGNGMSLADQIFAMPTSDVSGRIDGNLDGAFTELPTATQITGTGTLTIPRLNLVVLQSATVIPALDFQAQSDNPSVVQILDVSSAGVVTLLPGSVSGSANITVTATDRDGLSTSGTFSLISGGAGNTLVSTGTNSLTVSGTAGSAQVRVIASGAIPATVQYATVDGSAHAGPDYTGTNGTLLFTGSNSDEQDITIPLPSHLAPPPGKTFSVQLSVTPASGVDLGSPSVVTVNILDNAANPNGVLQFSDAGYWTDAGDNFAMVRVTRTGGTSGTVSAVVSTQDDTAVNGSDYTGLAHLVTFAPGDSAPKLLLVPILNSGGTSGTRAFNLLLTGLSGGATLGTNSTASVTISEQNPPGGTFSFLLPEVRSSGTAAEILVQRLGNTGTTASVYFSTANGTAIAGTHYTAVNGMLNFAAGQTLSTVTVPFLATSDTLNRTVSLRLSLPSANAALGVVAQASLVIAHDPQTQVIAFQQPAFQLVQGQTGTVTLTRTGPTPQGASALVQLYDATAAYGTDFTSGPIAGMVQVDFAPGSSTASFSVKLATEQSRRFFLAGLLTVSSGYAIKDQATASIDIVDQVAFSSNAFVVSGSDAQAQIAAVRSSTGSAVSVAYTTLPGTAIPGTDYTTTTGTLTFAVGETFKTFSVPIAVTSGTVNRALSLHLSAIAPDVVAGSDAQLVIAHDPSVGITQIDSSAYYAQQGQATTITFTRTGSLAGSDTATLIFEDQTAVLNSDYGVFDSSGNLLGRVLPVTFSAGSATASLSVVTGANSSPKTFNLRILSTASGNALGPVAVTHVQIVTDGFHVSPSTVRVSASGTDAAVTVVRTGTASGQSVAYFTTNGTAFAGTDFTQTSGTLTFAANETSKLIHIPILPVTAAADRTFGVHLAPLAPGAADNGDGSVILVHDAGTQLIAFSSTNPQISAGGPFSLGLTRTGAADQSVTALVRVENGTGILGSDFTIDNASGSFALVTFPAGSSSATLSGSISAVANGEGFGLRLVGVNSGYMIGDASLASVAIADNFAFWPANYVVNEANGQVVVTVARTLTDSPGSVQFATADGTAISGTDYTATSGTLAFAAGVATQDIPIALMPTGNSATRQFTVNLSNATGTVLNSNTTASVAITTTAPDGFITLSASSYTFDTQAGGTVTVIRNNPGQAVWVALQAFDGTAHLAQGDYTVAGMSHGLVWLNFAAGEGSKTVRVSGTTPGNFQLRLAGPTGGSALSTPNQATVNLVSNGSFSIPAGAYRINEAAGEAVIGVVRSGGTSGQVLVPFGTADNSAAAGTDYTATTGTLTFNSGVTAQDIHVPLKSTTSTSERTFIVGLGAPSGGAALGTPSQVPVTIVKSAPTGVFSLPATSYPIDAQSFSSSAGVMIVRSATGQAATVYASFTDGSAMLDRDYVALDSNNSPLSGQHVVAVNFAAGEYYHYLQISGSVTTPKTFTLRLVSSSTGSAVGTPNSASVTLLGAAGAGLIEFPQTSYRFSESAGTAVVAVTRTGSGGPISVTYSAFGGNAVAGVNYATTSGTLTFNPGETQKTISVPLLTTSGTANQEFYFNLNLLTATGGAGVGANSVAAVTIVKSPPAGTISFQSTSYQFNSGAYQPITVVRSGTVQAANAYVALLAANPTDLSTAFATNSPVSGILVRVDFAAGQASSTFNLGAISGLGNKTLTVQLATTSSGAAIGTPNRAMVSFFDTASPQFDSPTYRFTTTAGSAVARVTLAATSGTVSVVYSTANGTALAGRDYTTTSGTLTFQPGETEHFITVPLIKTTNTVNADRTFSIGLSKPTGVSSVGRVATTTVTVVKNATTGIFTLGQSSYRFDSGVYQQIAIWRTGTGTALSKAATVYVEVLDGSGKLQNNDYVTTLSAGAIVPVQFAAKQSSSTFQVGAYNGKGDVTINVRLVDASAGSAIGVPGSATVFFLDKNRSQGLVEFSQATFRANEAAGIAYVTVSRTGFDDQVTVHYATVNGSARAGTDYVAASGTLTFAPGIQSQTFAVRVTNNTLFQPSQSFYVTLSNVTGAAVLGGQSTATVNIVDDDNAAGVYQFESANYSFNQNAGWAELTVLRRGTTKSGDVLVGTVDSNGSLGRNVVYGWPAPTVAPGLVVHFEPGQDRQKLFLPLIDGALTSGSTASFQAYLATGKAGSLGFQNTTSVTVASAPQLSVPTVEFDSNEYRVNDSLTTVVLHAKLYGSSTATISVPFQVVPSAAARLGVDFTLTGSAANVAFLGSLNGTLTFPAGATACDLPIGIKRSTATTAEKQFSVQLGLPDSGALLLTQTTARVTIVNSNSLRGIFEFDKAAYQFDQDCGTAKITLLRKGTTAQLAGSAQVTVATDDGSAIGREYNSSGTFTGFGNFGYNWQTFTFGPNETSKSFCVQVLKGTLSGASARFLVRIESALSGARAGALDRTVVTLENPSKLGSAGFEFDKPYYQVNETAGSVAVTVRRVDLTGSTSTVSDSMTVAYSTVNGAGRAGIDYIPIAGTLTFNPGQATARLTVRVLNRSLALNRAIYLRLSNAQDLTQPSVSFASLPDSTATVEIRGSRSAYGLFQFDRAAYTVAASAKTVPVILVRSGATSAPATVQIRSGNGTAAAGVDYSGFDQFVSFVAGESRLQLSIPVINAHAGAARYFAVQLFPTAQGATGALDTATVTITPAR